MGSSFAAPSAELTFLLGIVEMGRARAGYLRAAARRAFAKLSSLTSSRPPELLGPAAGVVGARVGFFKETFY